MSTTKIETSLTSGALPEWLALVWRQVGSLRYGAVEIVVHDSRVIQIEKIERLRLDKPTRETGKQTKTK
ncbi:MAG TPA: YezD family protein [Verrucomicrobiae bacterium]